MESEEIIPIPVTILTGFLGAGKTTFLNKVLSTFKDKKFAIIENELGEEGIDGELIMKAEDDIFEMNNGCLCCTLNDNLYDILVKLWERREEFDELIIETTGIADPANVAMPFLGDPTVAKHFRLDRVIGLADASLIENQLEDTREAPLQLSFSDIILVNKTDAVQEIYVAELMENLQGINPYALVMKGSKLHYPLEEIWAFQRKNTPVFRPSFALSNKVKGPSVLVQPQHQHHFHSDIVSLSFRFEQAFNYHELYYRLTVFLKIQAKDIYRVKGIVHCEGHPKRLIIQSVGDFLSIDYGEPWGENEPRLSRMVFIGKMLRPDGFEKLLKDSLDKSQDF